MQNTMTEIKETLLIVLIHGYLAPATLLTSRFYGGEDTFGELPRVTFPFQPCSDV